MRTLFENNVNLLKLNETNEIQIKENVSVNNFAP